MKTLTMICLVAGAAFGTMAQASTRACYIQTYSGNYLTAVGGGDRIDDVIHSDATRGSTWETFKIVESSSYPGTYGIKTLTGNYLTVVGGGGRTDDVIHSDATRYLGWEQLRIEQVGGGYVAFKTSQGYYLTAVAAGGRITDVIHSDATQVSLWEKFKLVCSR